jgi:hypothetical protein
LADKFINCEKERKKNRDKKKKKTVFIIFLVHIRANIGLKCNMIKKKKRLCEEIIYSKKMKLNVPKTKQKKSKTQIEKRNNIPEHLW